MSLSSHKKEFSSSEDRYYALFVFVSHCLSEYLAMTILQGPMRHCSKMRHS